MGATKSKIVLSATKLINIIQVTLKIVLDFIRFFINGIRFSQKTKGGLLF